MTLKSTKAEPELRLLSAFLDRALMDVYDLNQANNSQGWFFDDSMEPFSFLWCLQVLDLEDFAPRIRRMINDHIPFNVGCLAMKRNGIKACTKKEDWYTQKADTPLKECTMCHKILPETDFWMINQISRYPMCKACHKIYLAEKRSISLCVGHRSHRRGRPPLRLLRPAALD